MTPEFRKKLTSKSLYWIVCGLEAVLAAFGYFFASIPAASSLKLDTPLRIICVFSFLFLGLFFFFLARMTILRNYETRPIFDWLRRKRWEVVTVSSGGLSLLIILLSRTQPAGGSDSLNVWMSWMGVLLFSLLLTFLIYDLQSRHLVDGKSEEKFLAGTLIVFSILWILVSVTRIGLQPDDRYWNVAGVPMMLVSLLVILSAIIFLHNMIKKLLERWHWKFDAKLLCLLEVGLVLIIWLGAALLWMKTPYSNSYFLYGPFPPDGHFLPKSDAQLMDLGGQYLIIGGKLETPYFTEKPFYALFLGLLHYFFGQSYQIVTNVQILFLAFIPVLLYSLGKKFAGAFFGVSLALYAITKEATSILFTYKISVSNSRLMMTEMPSALLLILAAILILEWLRRDHPHHALPLAAGGVLGVAAFVRSNNFVVLVGVVVFVLLISLGQLKKRLAQFGFFLLGVVLILAPWTVYTETTYDTNPISWKIEAALDTRFNEKVPGRDERSTQLPPEAEPTNIPDIQTQPNSGSESAFPARPQESADSKLPLEAPDQDTTGKDYKSKLVLVLAHFFNNQIKALFVLPFQLYPARPTVILDNPYWQEPVTWAGKLPLEHWLAFLVNLIFIGLGLSHAWKKFAWAGLTPLMLEVSYYLSNALVRTSGSRYLVAVDWAVYFYFLLGIWAVLLKHEIVRDTNSSQVKDVNSPNNQIWAALLPCLLIGLSLPVLNLAFPEVYHNETKMEVYQRLPLQKIESEVGISAEEMRAFYEKPTTVFLFGREIYPAYQELKSDPIVRANTFKLLTPKPYDVYIADGEMPSEALPAGEDMIVLGCRDADSPWIKAYLGYFVKSDKLIWSTNTTFRDICP